MLKRLLAISVLCVACSGASGQTDAGDALVGRDAGDTGSEDTRHDASVAVRTFVYVGLTTGDLVTLDGATLGEVARTHTGNFPSFIASSADGAHLYVVHESGNELASIDVAHDGRTSVTSRRSALGGPTFVAIDHAGRHVFTASYGSGQVYAFGIAADGTLAATPTSTAVVGTHAHQSVPNASDTFLYVPCLGDDRVVVEHIGVDGSLTPASSTNVATGAGPRHLALTADGHFAYLIDETGSTLDVLSVDATTGALTDVQTVSTLPAGFTGTNACAEVLVSADQRFVYGSNRGHDSVVVFARDATSGRLTLVEHEPVGGMHPRSMTLSRDAAHLYVAARDSDLIAVFDVGVDGRLTAARTLPMPGHPYFIGEMPAP